MIDTIVLTLSHSMFHISDPDKFEPSAQWILAHASPSMQSKQNPTKKELLNGEYKPRLTLSRRFNMQGHQEVMLKIELSLPKLLFGNNFDELQQKDFKELVYKLVVILKKMGIVTTVAVLSKASVSAIHYSKNIVLTDGSTPYYFINKIKEANIKLSLDVNQTDYRNEGHSYKWHCNSYEVAFYDKIKDLEVANKSEKRSLEKDNGLQLNFLQDFEKRGKLEILRMEVRLNKRQKINQLFKKLNIDANLTFKSLFKRAIARNVLLHYINELESKRSLLLDYKATNDKALLATLIFNNPQLGPKKILQLYGLKKAFEMVNPRELRGMFGKYNQRSWYRLMAEAREVVLPINEPTFAVIRRTVIKFKPLKLKNTKNKLR